MAGRLPVKVVPLPQVSDVLQVRAYADAAVKAAFTRCAQRGRPLYQQAANEAQNYINAGYDDAGNMLSGSQLNGLLDLLERANNVCGTEYRAGVAAADQPASVHGDAPAPFDEPPPQPVVPVTVPDKTAATSPKKTQPAYTPPKPAGTKIVKSPTNWLLWGSLAFVGVVLFKGKKKPSGKRKKPKTTRRKRRR